MKYKTVLIPIVMIIIAFGLMQLLSGFRKEPPSRTPAPQVKVVDVQVVQLDDVAAQIRGFGTLSTTQPVQLISEVAGALQMGSIPFLPGQSFRRGDLLVKIDDRQILLDVNSAKSDLLTALASFLPEINVDFPGAYPRWQSYFDQIDFEKDLPQLPPAGNRKIKLYLARFNIYKLYFAVKNLEIRREKHYFRALFDGSIISTDLRIGSTARAGVRLGEVVNLEAMEVQVPVSTRDIPWIDPERSIRLTSRDIAGEWQGRIARIGSAIDPRTQTVPLYITPEGAAHSQLFEGAFLQVEIPGKTVEAALSIPQKAIYEENNVYLIKQGRLAYQPVQIARRELESVIVTGGLANGDSLVIEVLQGVAPGMLAKARDLALSKGEAQ